MQSTQQPTAPAGGRSRTAVTAALVGTLSLGGAVTVLLGPSATASTMTTSSTRRVDLTAPTFSHPTRITNPLFPIRSLDQVVQLGAEGDVALRHEITLLDRTRVIRWKGQRIEAAVSQFVAYGDGEILEVATDYFAQADDGAVWYLGEDVANYEQGKVVDHDGTWLAGRDGPAGMIMPANPRVGDVYRPENIPGVVFEEVTVKKTNVTVDGPTGRVRGAIRVQERLLDGTLEDKVFAPGYGEFEASVPTADELVTVAVAVPIDNVDGRTPKALDRLTGTARKVFAKATTSSWSRLETLTGRAHRAWHRVSAGDVPQFLDDQVGDVLGRLDSAVASRSRTGIRQAALELELATLDVEMQYDDLAGIDEDRVDVWRLQKRLHQGAGDSAGAASDRAIIAAIKDRLPR